jgi:hypothetical protein
VIAEFMQAQEAAAEKLAPIVGRRKACNAVDIAQASWYRRHRRSPPPQRPARPAGRHPRALTGDERAAVLEVLHSQRFVDMAPAEVYATLLDEGTYLCSEATMHFFTWYNHDHRHSGIGLHTPADVHYGRAELIQAHRADVLTGAYQRHPERFVRKHPQPPRLPEAAWINKPTDQGEDQTNTTQN